MRKCRSLVSKKVSISLLRGLSLGRENERLGLVKIWEGLGLVSEPRTEKQTSRSRLGLTIHHCLLLSVLWLLDPAYVSHLIIISAVVIINSFIYASVCEQKGTLNSVLELVNVSENVNISRTNLLVW